MICYSEPVTLMLCWVVASSGCVVLGPMCLYLSATCRPPKMFDAAACPGFPSQQAVPRAQASCANQLRRRCTDLSGIAQDSKET